MNFKSTDNLQVKPSKVIRKSVLRSLPRPSQIRDATVQFLKDHKKPASVGAIVRHLKCNKTSVYRGLKILIQHKTIKEIDLGDGEKRYEMANQIHHHHLICTKCGVIKDVYMPNDLKQLEQKIQMHNPFKIDRHSLEFFGRCRKCYA